MSTSPIMKIDDLNRHKIWTPTNNKQAELTLKAFGLTPIPLNIGDVLAGLQTHLIDTVAISPIAAIALQWHTQIKYVTDIPLTYLYATLVIDKKAFSKVSKDDQNVVRNIMNKIFKRIDEQNRKDNVSAFSALVNQGIKVLSPNSEEMDIWYKKGQKARTSIKVKGILSKESYNQIIDLLTEFRMSKETLGAAR